MILLLCVTNEGVATEPPAWDVTKAQKSCRQRDAPNCGWRLLWKADGLQPQQRPGSQTHQLINDCHPPSQGPSNTDAHSRGRYGTGLRRRGLTLHSTHVGITVWTNKRLEGMTRKKWSHVQTSLTPVWCHNGRYLETVVAPGHICFGVFVVKLNRFQCDAHTKNPGNMLRPKFTYGIKWCILHLVGV